MQLRDRHVVVTGAAGGIGSALARRFHAEGRPGWAAYSVVTGVGFLMSFVAIASGSTSASVLLTFYGAVGWIWIWHTLLLARLARETR